MAINQTVTAQLRKIFPAKKCVAWITFFAIFVGLAGITHAAKDAEVRSPEATALVFYSWYLKSLASDRDPLTDDATQIAGFVSKHLILELKRKRESVDGLDSDYFLQAQDYLDEWAVSITASEPKISRSMATVVLTLGNTPEGKRRLKLKLLRERGSWKIRKVDLCDEIAWGSIELISRVSS